MPPHGGRLILPATQRLPLRELWKTYHPLSQPKPEPLVRDFKALKDISLDMGEREITALIGKSTFLKTLNRMNDLVPGVRIEGMSA